MMYLATFTIFYHKHQPFIVGKYTISMDPMGYAQNTPKTWVT